jgi:cell wall-associated NlpC family hydrolase
LSALDRFVGIPYLDQGRTAAGLDCYGLVVLVYREIWGIELPSYAERYVTGADRRALAGLVSDGLCDWREIGAGDEDAFDVCLMRDGREISHVGLVVGYGRVLHVERGGLSRIERYRNGMLGARVAGFYRYALAS